MTIQQTILHIDDELSGILRDYEEWFRLTPEMLRFKPHDRWSIEQILEHVTLTNHFLLILIRKGTRKAKDSALKSDLNQAVSNYEYNLEALDQIARHNSFKWIRPEHMEPNGEKSTAEVKLLLEEQIEECQQMLRQLPNGEGILYKTMMTVNNLGKIDVYQYLYFLCLHARRHISQMQGVMEEYRRFHTSQ
ncbi:DinB family protein [Paenibacillus kobensis]|uniref:DinB family protein n=1 Tax=Paenibacillus kobensis TaxID=59841 RepID=UPI000FD82EFD|nr:DinB family protein [Paenibacillus kobensis]